MKTEPIEIVFEHTLTVKPEHFSNPFKMNSWTIILFDRMITNETIRNPMLGFQVHSDYTAHGEHWASKSKHYTGEAIDFHFYQTLTNGNHETLPMLIQWAMAERYRWGGLGIYPHWNFPGLHIDTRNIAEDGPESRWYRDERGGYLAIEAYLIKIKAA